MMPTLPPRSRVTRLGPPAAAFGVAALLLVAAGACSRAPDPEAAAPAVRAADAGPYTIVATVGMLADPARQVAGDRARVHSMIGTGVDPHLFKPTRNDVRALLDADLVLYAGLMLEGRMGDTLREVGRRKPVIAIAEQVESSRVLADGDNGHPDPHLWMDVGLWMEAVRAIEAALAVYDPAHRETYRANAARYLAELEALDTYARQTLASIPEHRRVLITAHDAFHYFGNAYGLDVRGIQGLSTESEAGLDDIRRLVQLLVDRDIGAVFVESSVPDKNVRALIEGAGARGHAVRVGGELFSDAMGAADTYEGTYIGMLDHNITTIARALGGDAPARGLHGRLAAPHSKAAAAEAAEASAP